MGWVRWIGVIFVRNIWANGRTISSRVGVFIYGYNLRVKANIWETDIKEIGRVEFVKVLVSFITLMDLDMKVIGKIIWKKGILFIWIKMEKIHSYSSVKIEWSKQKNLISWKHKTPRKYPIRRMYNLITMHCASPSIISIAHPLQTCRISIITSWETTLSWRHGIRAHRISTTSNLSLVFVLLCRVLGKWLEV
jgi:hypothetical protein